MRVCSQCLWGLSPNLSQYHTWSIWNWWFEKKKNSKWNLIKGADLQVNVSKAKVICLRGNRNNFSSQSRYKFSRKKPNRVRNVPNLDKKKPKRWLEVPNFQSIVTESKERYRISLVWFDFITQMSPKSTSR